MLIPESNGRETLLEHIRARFDVNPYPTLATVVSVVQDTTLYNRIDDTSRHLVIEAWPMGTLLHRTIDVAVCIGLGCDDPEWDESPGQIVVNFKTPGGVFAGLASRHSGFLHTDQIDDAPKFLDDFRATRLYRRYANTPSSEFSVKLWGGDNFIGMMGKVLPAMKEAGLIDCCYGGCEVADEAT